MLWTVFSSFPWVVGGGGAQVLPPERVSIVVLQGLIQEARNALPMPKLGIWVHFHCGITRVLRMKGSFKGPPRWKISLRTNSLKSENQQLVF